MYLIEILHNIQYNFTQHFYQNLKTKQSKSTKYQNPQNPS